MSVMKYHPRYLSATEIVKQAGFVSANLGYQYPLPDKHKIKRRLHCTTHYGFINLHKDEDYDKKRPHKTVNECGSVKWMLGEFKKIDRKHAPWYRRTVLYFFS